MFGFFKKNKKNDEDTVLTLVAPATGKVVPIEEIPDPVFAGKMAGDGIGIDITGDTIVAPADGEITLLFKTKHAFAMTLAHGIEILVHIGIETVALNGEGFEQLVNQGDTVKAGTPILKIDREFIKSKGCPLVSPVLITNIDSTKSLKALSGMDAVAGETPVVEYTV